VNRARCESSEDFTNASLNTPVVVDKKDEDNRQKKESWKLSKYTSFGAQQEDEPEKSGHQAPPPQTKVGEHGEEPKVWISISFFFHMNSLLC
jgi:hypothetical protein